MTTKTFISTLVFSLVVLSAFVETPAQRKPTTTMLPGIQKPKPSTPGKATSPKTANPAVAGGNGLRLTGTSTFGPWKTHPRYKGVQLRARLREDAFQKNAQIEGVFQWELEMRNNYSDDISSAMVQTMLDDQDPKRSIGGPSYVKAHDVSLPFSMTSVSKTSIGVFLTIGFAKEKDKKNSDGTRGKFAAFDDGAPSEFCEKYVKTTPACPNYVLEPLAPLTGPTSAELYTRIADNLRRNIFTGDHNQFAYGIRTRNVVSNPVVAVDGDKLVVKFTYLNEAFATGYNPAWGYDYSSTISFDDLYFRLSSWKLEELKKSAAKANFTDTNLVILDLYQYAKCEHTNLVQRDVALAKDLACRDIPYKLNGDDSDLREFLRLIDQAYHRRISEDVRKRMEEERKEYQ